MCACSRPYPVCHSELTAKNLFLGREAPGISELIRFTQDDIAFQGLFCS